MFDVTPDHDLRMLRLAVHGFWDQSVMAAYVAEVRRAMADLRRTGGCRYILVDMSGYPIQPKEIAEAHGALLRSSRNMDGIRVALVMQSVLSRLQANRLAAEAGHEIFDSREEAEAWLFAGGSEGTSSAA